MRHLWSAGRVQRWRVGDVEVVRIVDDEVALPPDALAAGWSAPLPGWIEPRFATDAGVLLAFSALAIRAADGTRLVVDPWLVNDAARTRDGAAEHVDGLLARLASAGFPADDVDTVVLSHIDGVGWITRPSSTPPGWGPTFPRARYLLAHDERERWRAGPEAEQLDVLEAAGQLELVDRSDPVEVLAPGVTLEAAPGHSAGHLAVRIESGGRLALYAGHLFLTPLQVADPSIPNDEEPQLASGVRFAVLGELAERHGLLLTTIVGGPGGGLVHEAWDGPGYRLEPI